MTAATGTTWSAIRRATSCTTSAASASPARAAAKMSRVVVGRGERRCARPPGREPRRERRDGAGARVDVLVQPDEREVDLSGRPVATAVELAAQDEAGAHAGADREEEEVVDTAGDALPLLPERRQVDVVLEPDAEPEVLLELGREGRSLEAGDARRERDRPALGVDDAGHADDGAVDEAVRPGSRSRRRARPAARRSASSTRGASAPSISTSSRARTSPRRSQIAPRRKRPPRSSPSASAASGTGSKKTAP